MTTAGRGGRTRSSSLSAVFRVPAFRAIWAAEVLSVAGDQLARLGLTIIVLQRTGSPALSAVVYALTFLPALVGGLLLGHLADRFPRRAVMVVSDLVRGALVVVMAIPGIPLWMLAALIVAVVLAGTPFAAAQNALLPDVLPGDLLARGMAVRQITTQTAQVVGFGAGGLLVALLSPGAALLLNAVTFGVSAALVRFLVRAGTTRPCSTPPPDAADDAAADAVLAGAGGAAGPRAAWAEMTAGLRVVLQHPRRRYLACAAWVLGLFVLPEALAASYADAIGAGPLGAGLLMAADPAGSVVGAVLFTRLVPPERRDRWVVPLAAGAALPLAVAPFVVGLFESGLAPSLALFALCGAAATACLIQVQSGFVRATPTAVRGRAVAVAASGLVAAQGVAILLGGLVAQHAGPTVAVATGGVAGLALALCMLVPGPDARHEVPAATRAPA